MHSSKNIFQRSLIIVILFIGCHAEAFEFATRTTDEVNIGYTGLPDCELYVIVTGEKNIEYMYNAFKGDTPPKRFVIPIGQEARPFIQGIAKFIKATVVGGPQDRGLSQRSISFTYTQSVATIFIRQDIFAHQPNGQLITFAGAMALRHLPKELEHLRKGIAQFQIIDPIQPDNRTKD